MISTQSSRDWIGNRSGPVVSHGGFREQARYLKNDNENMKHNFPKYGHLNFESDSISSQQYMCLSKICGKMILLKESLLICEHLSGTQKIFLTIPCKIF